MDTGLSAKNIVSLQVSGSMRMQMCSYCTVTARSAILYSTCTHITVDNICILCCHRRLKIKHFEIKCAQLTEIEYSTFCHPALGLFCDLCSCLNTLGITQSFHLYCTWDNWFFFLHTVKMSWVILGKAKASWSTNYAISILILQHSPCICLIETMTMAWFEHLNWILYF